MKFKREGTAFWYIGLILCWIGYALMLEPDERQKVVEALRNITK